MKLVAISSPWSYSNNLIATIKSFIIYNIKIKIISSFTYDHKTVVIRFCCQGIFVLTCLKNCYISSCDYCIKIFCENNIDINYSDMRFILLQRRFHASCIIFELQVRTICNTNSLRKVLTCNLKMMQEASKCRCNEINFISLSFVSKVIACKCIV